MSFELSYRPTQTKIKHHILDQYLKAWGGIIVNGSRNQARLAREKGNDFAVHFVYVDCNAYAGRYLGEQEEIASGETPTTVFGSPIVGVEALDSLVSYGNEQEVPVKVNAILIEEDRETYDELMASLKLADLDNRARETQDFGSLLNKEIAILHRDSLDLVSDLVQYTQEGFKFSLYFLDPYGPKGIPIGFVRKIVQQERHDTIINMPYQALHRRTGSVMKQNPTDEERKLVEHFDDMFGNSEWQKSAKQLEEEITWKEILEEATGIEGGV
ncbi:MAG: hypothetical protein DWQ07_18770 [Chloroflexi bacterium]|nr:MAG: hypothetical protein DWQ07_18770 [Chloroflexota bacterium]MBL1194976.1 three-Cys-motif partner protein TcmP [Chloroflexota bacterium]NOH12264.1 three-Cys-motif partner protein TcmP [Chloroflexota bacterium]